MKGDANQRGVLKGNTMGVSVKKMEPEKRNHVNQKKNKQAEKNRAKPCSHFKESMGSGIDQEARKGWRYKKSPSRDRRRRWEGGVNLCFKKVKRSFFV